MNDRQFLQSVQTARGSFNWRGERCQLLNEADKCLFLEGLCHHGAFSLRRYPRHQVRVASQIDNRQVPISQSGMPRQSYLIRLWMWEFDVGEKKPGPAISF